MKIVAGLRTFLQARAVAVYYCIMWTSASNESYSNVSSPENARWPCDSVTVLLL